ncbi:MAG: hypothetical protein AAGB12_16610 [Pseudomonadota bacterium]
MDLWNSLNAFFTSLKTSDFIALIAFFVSLLAALYSRRAAIEAQRANNILIHNKQIEIYEKFNDIRITILWTCPEKLDQDSCPRLC